MESVPQHKWRIATATTFVAACAVGFLVGVSTAPTSSLFVQPAQATQVRPAPTVSMRQQQPFMATRGHMEEVQAPQSLVQQPALTETMAAPEPEHAGPIVSSVLSAVALALGMAAASAAKRLFGPKSDPEGVMAPLAMAAWTGDVEKGSEKQTSASAPKGWRAWKRSIGMLAATGLLCCLLLIPSDPAMAAKSGGRMGGTNFRSAPTRMAPSRSAPSGGMASQSFQAPPLRGGFAPSYGFFPMPLSYGLPMGGYGYYGGGGFLFGGLFNLFFFGMVFYFVANWMSGIAQGLKDGVDSVTGGGADKSSVAKVQIGLLGLAKGLQKDLEKTANNADTNRPEGMQFVLQETVLALLRNPDYCVYGYSMSVKGLNDEQVEDRFNQESMSERGKFQNETLVNFGGRAKTTTSSGQASDYTNELIVVTILVACDGALELDPINDGASLRAALNKLGGVRRDGLLAVEVLWTPQEEGDTFTQEEVVQDYPLLNRL